MLDAGCWMLDASRIILLASSIQHLTSTSYEGTMRNIWQDLRYGSRMLLKTPGFTLIAVIILALGIGGTTTIFSFVNGILLRPLPYQDSERLVRINEISSKRGPMGGISFPNFLDWREQNQFFTGIAAWGAGGYTLTGNGDPEQLTGSSISYNTFEVLGVAPLHGRTFSADEDRPENDLVVILGHGLWERRFGANREIIGQKIMINNRSRTVIGVMPPGFKFPEIAELWVPLALNTTLWTRNDHGLGCVARLKPDATLAQSQADMNAVARRIEEQNPVTNEGMGVTLALLHDDLVSDYRKALLILLGVVGLVLLIACANVANLLLARASVRQKEVAIRAALGAGRWRIFRQLLTESFLLGIIGGALGLGLAFWSLDLLLKAIPVDLPFWMKINIDNRVLVFTLGISVLTGLIFGSVPAVQGTQVDLNKTLKEGGRSARGTSHHRMRRRLLVITEIGLSLILLIGAGLMMRSFLRLQQVEPGFDPENVLTMRVSVPGSKYDTPEKRYAFFKGLLERADSLPGVQAAGATSNLPLVGGWGRSLTVEGFPVLSVGQAPMIRHHVITPNYLKARGSPIMQGRDFT